MSRSALIVGAGAGLGSALARGFAASGHRVGLAARDTGKLADLQREIGAEAFACDVTEPGQVSALFEAATASLGPLDVVIFNANARRRGVGADTRGPLPELDPDAVRQSLLVNAFGGFLVGQAAARVMLPRGSGTILLMGASASVKGYAQSPAFAMGKFALRGLAQSMGRELGPQGIHVAHVVIDGAISGPNNHGAGGEPDSRIDPDAITATCLHLAAQPRSSWTHEIDTRPWTEKF